MPYAKFCECKYYFEELLDLLEEDNNLLQAVSIETVYIPKEVAEVTDKEVIDDDVFEDEMDLPDVFAGYEVHLRSWVVAKIIRVLSLTVCFAQVFD